MTLHRLVGVNTWACAAGYCALICLFFLLLTLFFFKKKKHFYVHSLSAPPSLPPLPRAPFSTVCECRSIRSFSLSGSFAACSPQQICRCVFIRMPNMFAKMTGNPQKRNYLCREQMLRLKKCINLVLAFACVFCSHVFSCFTAALCDSLWQWGASEV